MNEFEKKKFAGSDAPKALEIIYTILQNTPLIKAPSPQSPNPKIILQPLHRFSMVVFKTY